MSETNVGSGIVGSLGEEDMWELLAEYRGPLSTAMNSAEIAGLLVPEVK